MKSPVESATWHSLVFKASPIMGHGLILAAAFFASDSYGEIAASESEPAAAMVRDSTSAYTGLEDSLSSTLSSRLDKVTVSTPSDTLELKAVTVKQSRKSEGPDRAALGVSVVDLKAKRSAPMDLKSTLQTASGIHLRQNGGAGSSFDININGLQGKAVKVFVDGVLQDSRSAELALNTLSAEDLDRIEVYKGVLPSELGADALGGGINLVTRGYRSDVIEGGYEAGSFGSHQVRGRVNKRLGAHAFVRAEGSWGMAENDFPMEVLGTHPVTRKQMPMTVTRFHDAWDQARMEGRFGFQEHPVIGNLEAILGWSAFQKDLQHGASAQVPFGEASGSVSELMPRLDWNRAWLDQKLKTGLFVNYTWNQTALVDSSSRQYNWDGTSQTSQGRGGEIDATNKSLAKLETHTVTTRSGGRYALDSSLSLVLNYSWVGLERYGKDPLGQRLLGSGIDPLTLPSEYHRHYLTLGMEGRPARGRLGYEVLAKGYGFSLEGPRASYGYYEEGRVRESGAFAGGALALKWAPKRFIFRSSYERAMRFPDQDELLGDGFFVLPNYYLVPEKSHNFNLGGSWISNHQGPGRVFADVNAFARMQEDIIRPRAIGLMFLSNFNAEDAYSLGLEAGGGWEPWRGFKIEGNATYQSIRKLTARDKSEEYLLGSRLPNIPYFFANHSFSQDFKSLLGSGDGLTLAWNARYVHEFLLLAVPAESESPFFWQRPDVQTEYLIPSQYLHNVSLTYHLPGRWVSLGFEARNLFDAAAYDNFRVPRPGRSLHSKITARY